MVALVAVSFILILSGCAMWPQSREYREKKRAEQLHKSSGIYAEARKYRIRVKPGGKDPVPEALVPEREKEIEPYKRPEKERKTEDLFFPSDEEEPAAVPVPAETGKEIPVSIQFEGAQLKDILDTIIVEIMEGSYVLEAQPRQTLSFSIKGSFTPGDMLATLRIMFDSINLGLACHRGVYHIIPAKAATVIAEDMHMLIRIPQNVRVENLIPILKDLKSQSGKLVTIQGSNLLFMLDYPANTERAAALINIFDVAFFKDRHICIYSLKNALAADVVSELDKLLKQANVYTDKVPASVRLIPVQRLNKVVAFGTSAETMNYLDIWIDILDQEYDEADRAVFFTYMPKYCLAKDLSQLLSNLFPKLKKDEQKGLDAYAETEANLLVIRACRSVYYEARELIAAVDIQPTQVFVQAVLAEIMLDEDMDLGFEWFFNKKFGEANIEIGSTIGNLAGKALTISMVASDFYGILGQLINEQDAKILATPHILVKNKQEASIEIKTQVPVIKSFLTTDIQTAGTSAQQPSIEYKDAGVILKVQPNIISGDEVEIFIEQELSSPTEIILLEGLTSYKFDTRKIQTTLLLKDQQTILIGGLIKEDVSSQTSHTPWLGDLPLIKYFFRTESKSNTRTELVLFLTPTIVTDTNDLKKLTKQITALYSSVPKGAMVDNLKDDK